MAEARPGLVGIAQEKKWLDGYLAADASRDACHHGVVSGLDGVG